MIPRQRICCYIACTLDVGSPRGKLVHGHEVCQAMPEFHYLAEPELTMATAAVLSHWASTFFPLLCSRLEWDGIDVGRTQVDVGRTQDASSSDLHVRCLRQLGLWCLFGGLLVHALIVRSNRGAHITVKELAPIVVAAALWGHKCMQPLNVSWLSFTNWSSRLVAAAASISLHV